MELTDRQKQYLLIAGFIAGVIVIAVLLYIVFFRPTGTTDTPPANTNGEVNGSLPNVNDILGNVNIPNGNANNGELPGIDDVGIGGGTTTTVLTPETVTQYTAPDPAAQGNGMRYYDPNDGKFYRVNANGVISQIGSAQFPGAENVTWSTVGDDVIVEFPDGANVYYNLRSNKQVTLPREFDEFDFSPNGSQIAFKYLHPEPERRVLAVSNPDGSQARTLESLGENGHRVHVNWSPTGKIAAGYAEFIDANRQEVGFVGLANENFKGVVIEGRGFQYKYSGDGARMLYSTYTAQNEYRPTLKVVDADGDAIGNNRRELGVSTFVEKCGFGKDPQIVYCGVPTRQVAGYGLESRLLEGIPDALVRIDLRTGTQTQVAVPLNEKGEPAYAVDYNSLVVTDDNEVIFRDQRSQKIVKVRVQ